MKVQSWFRRALLIAMAASMAVCATALATLGAHVRDARDLVRIRNAMLFEIGTDSDFDWTPAAAPQNYKLETGPVPEPIAAANAAISVVGDSDGEFRHALAIAAKLVRNHKSPAVPIQSDTVTAYEQITQYGYGYCADFTQVFNALAYSAHIPVREWGMSFDNYGGDGHAFNEIYDRASGRWVFIDSFFSFYAVDDAGRAMSVKQFRDSLDDRTRSPHLVPIDTAQFRFKSQSQALDYYRRGAREMYLWSGNNVLALDRNPLVRLFAHISRSAEQLAAMALGLHPHIVIPPDDIDSDGVAVLQRIRLAMSVAALSAAIAFIIGLLLLLLRYHGRARNSSYR